MELAWLLHGIARAIGEDGASRCCRVLHGRAFRHQSETMHGPKHIRVFDRRHFVMAGGSALALLGWLGGTARAEQAGTSAAPRRLTWQEALKAMIGPAEPVEGRLKVEMPEAVENGNVVPFTVTVDSPMTDDDFVRAVHILSTANPKPDVASAFFSPLSGKAVFGSRMRLGRTQEIVAVAEMSDGKVYLGKCTVKVTIGGCGTG